MTRILGYKEGTPPPPERPRVDPIFHKWFCQKLQQAISTLYLLPRDHTKSVTGAVIRTIQRLLKIPNVSLMLASKTLARSKASMSEIRANLANPKLTFLFPDKLYERPAYASKRGELKWTDEGFNIKRTRVRSDDSVWCVGIGKSIAGFHPDEIILDDIIDQDTVATETQSKKVETWWEYLQPIASTRCIFSIFGTFYDDLDLYHKLLKEVEKGTLDFRVVKRAVEKDGKFIYNFYDSELLQKKKDTMSEAVFFQQYYNRTRSKTERIFKMNYRDYDKFPGDLLDYERIMTVDPGFSKSSRADYCGIVVCLYDTMNQVWVEIAKRYKVSVVQLLDVIYKYDEVYKLDHIGIESGTWQSAIEDIFEYIVTTENRKVLPIVPLSTGTQIDAKHRRIVGTAAYCEKGIARLHTDPEGNEDYTSDLKTEMYYYSTTSRQHDDVLDGFAMQHLVHQWGDADEELMPKKYISPEEELENWRKKHDTYSAAFKKRHQIQRSWTDY